MVALDISTLLVSISMPSFKTEHGTTSLSGALARALASRSGVPFGAPLFTLEPGPPSPGISWHVHIDYHHLPPASHVRNHPWCLASSLVPPLPHPPFCLVCIFNSVGTLCFRAFWGSPDRIWCSSLRFSRSFSDRSTAAWSHTSTRTYKMFLSQTCIEEYWADDITLLYPAFNVEPFAPMTWASLSLVRFPQPSAIAAWDTLLQ